MKLLKSENNVFGEYNIQDSDQTFEFQNCQFSSQAYVSLVER